MPRKSAHGYESLWSTVTGKRASLEFNLDNEIGRTQWEAGPQPSLRNVMSAIRQLNPLTTRDASAYHLGRNASRETDMFIGILSRKRAYRQEPFPPRQKG